MIFNYCFGSWAEYILDFMEIMGIIENWREKKEARDDENEFYGLTKEEIAICKEARAINKIKYEEAIKIRWEELSKKAIRPDDVYTKNLLKQSIKVEDNSKKDEDDIIEEIIEENKVDTIIKVLPGTPRRRRVFV
jgi:hypothetical protein